MKTLLYTSLALALWSNAAHAGELVFDDCLAGLRTKAEMVGIEGTNFDANTRDLVPDMSVLELLDAQPEFTTPIWDYLAALVDDQRISDGQAMLQANAATLARVSQQYGVDPQTVVAVWGVESDYGKTFGKRPLLVSLATLSCFGRRQEFFRGEFFATLKLLQAGDLKPEGLTGSWAGAFGHTQFMPTTYQRIAVDGDGDGRRDLVASIPDALASTANYLKQAGWRTGEPWGYEVKLPAGFDATLAGRKNKRPLSDWITRGVARVDGTPLLAADTQAARATACGPNRSCLPRIPQFRCDLLVQRGRELCAGDRHLVRPAARRRRVGHTVADRRSGPGPRRTQAAAATAAGARARHRRSGRHDRHADAPRDRDRATTIGAAAAGWARGEEDSRCVAAGSGAAAALATAASAAGNSFAGAAATRFQNALEET